MNLSFLLSLFSLFLVVVPAQARTLAIMEGTEVSNDTIYIDTDNARFGVGTSSPSTKLHISSGILTIDGSGGKFIMAGSSVGIGTTVPSAYFTIDATGQTQMHDDYLILLKGPTSIESTDTITGHLFGVHGPWGGDVLHVHSEIAGRGNVGINTAENLLAGYDFRVQSSTFVIKNGAIGVGVADPTAVVHIGGASSDTAVYVGGDINTGFNQGTIFKVRFCDNDAPNQCVYIDFKDENGNQDLLVTADVDIPTFDFRGVATIRGADPIVLSTMTATYASGSAHLCINDVGVIFASEAACP